MYMENPVILEYRFPADQLPAIKRKMLNWLRPFSIFAYLDNNMYNHKPCRYELLVAAGAAQVYGLQDLPDGEWLFGHLNYDYKNALDPGLSSRHPPDSGFPDCRFYRPEVVCSIAHGSNVLRIESAQQDAGLVLQAILAQGEEIPVPAVPNPEWKFSITPERYRDLVAQIRGDIEQGDYYELNLCVRAEAPVLLSDPLALFHKLNQGNPSPFAALYRMETEWMMGNSPERFLYRGGSRLVAQPIKGTLRRGHSESEQAELEARLRRDAKEQAEHVMITDLMRNDLARCCMPGSVKVPELSGLYHFPGLMHLISTVSGEVQPGLRFPDIIRNTFPMGSMTGAPKRIVMQRIDAYERGARGLFSGTVGYIRPDGDFDFNVNIRSLFYAASRQLMQYQTGGAITYQSDPEKEWEEVLLKAAAMQRLFELPSEIN